MPIKSSKLANISTRGFIQTGDNVMIGGFIMGGGTGATRVVMRGIGPSLGALGITNPLVDPMIELHDANGALIDSNDDWRTNQAVILSTGLAPTNDAESALLLANPAPGAYTAILAREEQRNGCWSSRGLRFSIRSALSPIPDSGTAGTGRLDGASNHCYARTCDHSRIPLSSQPPAPGHRTKQAHRFPLCLTKTIIFGI